MNLIDLARIIDNIPLSQGRRALIELKKISKQILLEDSLSAKEPSIVESKVEQLTRNNGTIAKPKEEKDMKKAVKPVTNQARR